jgi:hypothetical protein
MKTSLISTVTVSHDDIKMGLKERGFTTLGLDGNGVSQACISFVNTVDEEWEFLYDLNNHMLFREDPVRHRWPSNE